jgi:hypothetical protein
MLMKWIVGLNKYNNKVKLENTVGVILEKGQIIHRQVIDLVIPINKIEDWIIQSRILTFCKIETQEMKLKDRL